MLPDMIMTENLRRMIVEMQMDNCANANDQINYINGLMRELLRSECITPENDKERLRMLDKLSYIQMVFEAFIPPKEGNN